MKWQEYQKAVGVFYEQMSEMGNVLYNITRPDKITGQARQIDVWWEIKLEGHILNLLIDAKMRSSKIDVKDVEEILALAQAVNADKAIIVTNSDWTEPAKKFADFSRLDLMLLTLDEATDLVVPEKWKMCRICNKDCIIMDKDGWFEIDGKINWYLGGTCRSCNGVYVHCQDCGNKDFFTDTWTCQCPLLWKNEGEILEVYTLE